MEIDINKVFSKSPTNACEAIDALIIKEQKLLEAIHIMISIIENPYELEFSHKRMFNFLKEFTYETNSTRWYSRIFKQT